MRGIVPGMKPAEFTPYKTPWEYVFGALAQRQKKADQNMDLLGESLDAFDALQEGARTQGWKKQIRSSFEPLIDKLSTGIDPSSSEFASGLRNLKSNIATDRRILDMTKDYMETELEKKRMSSDPYSANAVRSYVDPLTGEYDQFDINAAPGEEGSFVNWSQNYTPYTESTEDYIDKKLQLVKSSVIRESVRSGTTDPIVSVEVTPEGIYYGLTKQGERVYELPILDDAINALQDELINGRSHIAQWTRGDYGKNYDLAADLRGAFTTADGQAEYKQYIEDLVFSRSGIAKWKKDLTDADKVQFLSDPDGKGKSGGSDIEMFNDKSGTFFNWDQLVHSVPVNSGDGIFTEVGDNLYEINPADGNLLLTPGYVDQSMTQVAEISRMIEPYEPGGELNLEENFLNLDVRDENLQAMEATLNSYDFETFADNIADLTIDSFEGLVSLSEELMGEDTAPINTSLLNQAFADIAALKASPEYASEVTRPEVEAKMLNSLNSALQGVDFEKLEQKLNNLKEESAIERKELETRQLEIDEERIRKYNEYYRNGGLYDMNSEVDRAAYKQTEARVMEMMGDMIENSDMFSDRIKNADLTPHGAMDLFGALTTAFSNVSTPIQGRIVDGDNVYTVSTMDGDMKYLKMRAQMSPDQVHMLLSGIKDGAGNPLFKMDQNIKFGQIEKLVKALGGELSINKAAKRDAYWKSATNPGRNELYTFSLDYMVPVAHNEANIIAINDQFYDGRDKSFDAAVSSGYWVDNQAHNNRRRLHIQGIIADHSDDLIDSRELVRKALETGFEDPEDPTTAFDDKRRAELKVLQKDLETQLGQWRTMTPQQKLDWGVNAYNSNRRMNFANNQQFKDALFMRENANYDPYNEDTWYGPPIEVEMKVADLKKYHQNKYAELVGAGVITYKMTDSSKVKVAQRATGKSQVIPYGGAFTAFKQKKPSIGIPTDIPAKDLVNIGYAEAIGEWYLLQEIPDQLWKFKIPINEEYAAIAYNWGIGNLVKWYKNGRKESELPAETRKYKNDILKAIGKIK